MKFAKFILPYVLISPVSVAVFFIALFVSCIAIEFVMNGMLHALESSPSYRKPSAIFSYPQPAPAFP